MEIKITDLTEEQAETVKAYAHAVKTQNVIGLEFKDKEDNDFRIKYGPEFYYDRSYRIKPQPSYLDLHKASGLKVGDKVKVIRKAEHRENGWADIWNGEEMDSSIGKVFEIHQDGEKYGFYLSNNCYYPYFVLEKIEEEWIVKFRFNNRWVLDELIYPSKEAAQTGLTGNGSTYEIIQIK